MIEHRHNDPEHDIMFRLFVRRHHVGPVEPMTGHKLIKKLKRLIEITSRGSWSVEVAEVASITRTRRPRA